ncbi:MAG: hypothetical protein J6V13_00780 [Paludibacteraceae bacterium]|nr:hypothetical protein [Paludibacteraceae bacterium]
MVRRWLLFAFVLLLVGCQLRRSVVRSSGGYVAQPDTTRLVSLPASVLYVLAREYESVYDSTRPKYYAPESEAVRLRQGMSMEKYMEERLMELFPHLVYEGMLGKMHRAALSMLSEHRNQLQVSSGEFSGVRVGGSLSGDAFYPYQGDEREAVFMSMSVAEKGVYDKLNALADSAGFARMCDFARIVVEDSTWCLDGSMLTDSVPYFLEENLGVSLLLSGIGSAMFYRVIQSKARAEYVAECFYPGGAKDGMRGDAFKHIYVNMLLRRYTSERLAWLIMDVYWEAVGNNAPCDMVMDLHNNQIGRSRLYGEFRGDDRYDWKSWAGNVLRFIEDTTSNSAYQSWNKELPLHFIRAAEEHANPLHYLYWNKSQP